MREEELYKQYLIETGQASPKQNNEAELYKQYQAEMAANQEPNGSALEAGVEAFGKAASFGYLPQMQAAVGPVIEKGLSYFLPKDPEGFTIEEGKQPGYIERRDAAVKRSQELEREHPTASLVGSIGGGLASGIATGGLMGAGRAATLGGRLAQGAKAGAVVGAVRNPGETAGEISPLQIGDRASNLVSDVATGAVFQGGLEGIGKVGQGLKQLPETIKTFSQAKALKASGAMLKDFRKAYGKGKVNELGQAMIDNGVVGVGDDVADIAKKAASAKDQSGKTIGAIYDKADQITSLNKNDIGDFVTDYNTKAAERLKGTIGGDRVAEKIEEVLSVIQENPNPTFGELRRLRASIDDEINFSKRSGDLPQYEKELLHIRNNLQDMVLGKIGKTNPKLKADLLKENRNFSNLTEIESIARDKMAREESNAAFGLRERIQGGLGGVIGASVGGVPGAIAGAAIGSISTKVARQYGTPFVAITANKAARMLENNPQALGKFSDALTKAANVSPKEFVSAVNLMIKEPEFKEKLRKER